ncbi:MAG: adenylate/guanylate cyclase domain-containing protein [Proteobacteria bacterium]|nr:adenylate/guanylate cyclase domain-containing protein [Pseudomonadota bacterium]
MSLSRRARREWRIVLWVSVISAAASVWFTSRVVPDDPILHSILEGVATSLLIATPIVLIELKGDRMASLRRLRRLPLALYFTVKVLFYFVIIVGGLVLSRYFLSSAGGIRFDETFRHALLFAIAMSVFGNFVFDMTGLLGLSTLKSLVTGRYVQPRREQRTFLLIDMKNSTGVAEKLGPVRFHELLNAFFRNVNDAALECEAEIHKYVGDEAILTWSGEEALAAGECLACPFLVRDYIAANRETYMSRFGLVPEFRAAIHCGEIVAGEIGDVRREIAFVGDTLNVAARLLDAAKDLGRDVLASQDILRRTQLPSGVKAVELPTLSIRGRAAPLAVAALTRA